MSRERSVRKGILERREETEGSVSLQECPTTKLREQKKVTPPPTLPWSTTVYQVRDASKSCPPSLRTLTQFVVPRERTEETDPSTFTPVSNQESVTTPFPSFKQCESLTSPAPVYKEKSVSPSVIQSPHPLKSETARYLKRSPSSLS